MRISICLRMFSICCRQFAADPTGQPMLLLLDADHAIPICLPHSSLYAQEGLMSLHCWH